MEPLKIGIVLNYKSAEKKKDELLRINLKRMPWLENIINNNIGYKNPNFINSEF
jgi:hypothetical protein